MYVSSNIHTATLSSRRDSSATPPYVGRFTLKVSSPMSNLRCRFSGMATSGGGCASRLSRNNVLGDAVFADEKTFVCNPRPNCRNDVIWTDDPSTIEPIVRVAHSVSINAFGAFSASGKSPLFFFFSKNLTAPALRLDP